MALTRVETDILWASAASKTLTVATPVASDAFTFDAACVGASDSIQFTYDCTFNAEA